MAFPDDILAVTVEAALGADLTADPSSWEWTDIGALGEGVYDDGDLVLDDGDPVTDGGWGRLLDQGLQTRRGRADESSRTQPASVSFTLDNPDGWLTPKNPQSPYFGRWGRGTPVRITAEGSPVTENALVVTASPGATSPDDPQLDIVGGIDIRFEADLDWGEGGTIVGRAGGSATIRYVLSVTPGQLSLLSEPDNMPGVRLTFRWTPPWVAGALTSPVLPVGTGRRAYRFTFEYDSAENLARAVWYQAASIDGPWTPWDVGDWFDVSSTGVVSAGSEAVTVGSGGVTLYKVEVRDDTDTLVIAPDFTAVTAGSSSFTDSTGLDWTINNGAVEAVVQSNPAVRLIGQVADLTASWPYGDIETASVPGEARVGVTVAGVLRRLGQAAKPLQSPIRRYLTRLAETWDPSSGRVAGYWPMEDGSEAVGAASGLAGGSQMRTVGASFADESTLVSSDSLPVFADGGRWYASFTPDTAMYQWYLSFVMKVADPTATGTFLHVSTEDTRYRVGLAANELTVTATDSDGSSVGSPFAAPFTDELDGWVLVSVFGNENGAMVTASPLDDFDWFLVGALQANVAGFSSARSQVLTGVTGTPLEGDSVGHVAVGFDQVPLTTTGNLGWAAIAHRAEPASARFARLCQEQSVPVKVRHPHLRSTPMGPQRIATFLDLLQECADADLAIIGEQRDVLGLTYRAEVNPAVALTLDASADEIANPFEPVDDDQRLRNDVTVTRQDGSAARVADDSSITADGLYDTDVRLNLAHDHQTAQQAGWRLHLGTWPGLRYPSVTVDLAIAPHLIAEVTALREGDRIHITGLPSQHPADTVDLLVEGIVETLSPTGWTFELTCSPAGPWDVAVLEDETLGRGDTAGCELGAAVDEDATSLSLVTTAGPVWIDSAAFPTEFPFDLTIRGERVTVTAITGTSSPQTATVTREVNGVRKPHPAGASVSLASPMILAL